MKQWLKIPREQRRELRQAYKKAGYSYMEAIKDFETELPKYQDGGSLTQKGHAQKQWINDWMGNRINVLQSNYQQHSRNPWAIDNSPVDSVLNRQISQVQSPTITADRAVASNKLGHEVPAIASGAFYPNQDLIFVDPNSRKGVESSTIHELTHAMTRSNDEPQNRHIRHIVQNSDNSFGDPFYKEMDKLQLGLSDYFKSDREIYARLMQLRYENNLNPSEIITIDKIKELRNNNNNELFKQFDDNTLFRLFNEVAQTQPTDELPMARYGGKLPKMQQG